MPTRFGVPFKLFWCYYAQRRAGRPRSSPFPLRGELMWYNEASTPTLLTEKVRRAVAYLVLVTFLLFIFSCFLLLLMREWFL
ncbi:MAG: hypothetical protein LBQ66_04595 [Planctomycetaceae bacterium]|nr:hypothetical protein [Planctomycetaceae bacterium]